MRALVLSIDAELGWGFHDLEQPPERRVSNARTGWSTLVDLLDAYDIPATWAIVGHLFLDECDGTHASHPLGPEWFDRERTEWADRCDLRFGSDLVDAVVDASADHEIACHTFSHVEFGDDRTTAAVARAELVASIRAARAYDVPFQSFVFPRNNVGHRDVLAEWGFSCYRGTQPRVGGRSSVARVVRKVAHSTVLAPPIVQPRIDRYGLVDIPASLFLFSFEGGPRDIATRVWADPVEKQVDRGIDRLAETDGVLHLWLHPNNVRSQADVDRLHGVFELIDRARSEQNIPVATMASVASSHRTEVGSTISSPNRAYRSDGR
ncbi:MAG: polysaccharide deacetylase family protein [Halobacteriota archaeon]